ncbi:f-box domain protein [Diplodia corticola]|uniref:F-box domain protein n=1 Tax=Diplodia corticola TaxID=236234 RepID=A0A1J9S5B4_9PEZI|nr:f-box domain protein [Diplodia corticola]OJD35703.1 f-box domain protein [Diplodia corticola]
MPHTQSAAELLELGKAFYGQRNYERALKAFIHAFGASASSDIRFLDMAVACHIKLGDLISALALGRKMTKHAAQDARGYLRMGQVLHLQEKPEMAIEVYKLGLRRCPSEDPEKIRLMQAKRDELTRRLTPPKSQDPIVVLPAEVMDLVMEHLNFKQRVTCLRVSKHWRDFLSHQAVLWSELDLSLARRPVPQAFVRNCIYRSKDKRTNAFLLHTAKFNRMRDPEMVMKLVKACRKLEALEFLGSELSGSSIKDPVLHCPALRSLKLGRFAAITLDVVTQILKARLTLVTAEFEYIEARRDATWDTDLPNLQSLSLGAGSVQELGVHVLAPTELINHIPNIKKLVLTGWKYHMGLAVNADFTSLQHLETLHLINTFFASQPRLPKSIKHLTLTASWGWSGHPSMIRMAETNLPVIEELNYVNEGAERDNTRSFIHALLHESNSEVAEDDSYKITHGESLNHPDDSSLRKFWLERCPSSSSEEIIRLLTELPRLHGAEDLTLVQAEFPDEVAFAQAIIGASRTPVKRPPSLASMLTVDADHYRNLRRLSIPSCKITGVGIKMLIKELRNRAPSNGGGPDEKRASEGLEYLNLDWCTSISSDAIEWARGQGIEVSWRTTVPTASGKKVKYA